MSWEDKKMFLVFSVHLISFCIALALIFSLCIGNKLCKEVGRQRLDAAVVRELVL